jgi:prepilin-type processing-associated H-X9-DG protein
LPLTYNDGAQLRRPLTPEYRFRDSTNDLFAGASASSFLQQNQSIYYPSDRFVRSITSSGGGVPLVGMNVDPGGTVMPAEFVGNVRFRHQRNTIANVAFADGSVQGMVLNKNRTISGDGGVESHETTILRRMIKIRWPSGFGPSGNLP